MNAPAISVVMSYHNRANLLRTTLESYEYYYSDIREDLEIVIVDDSSDEPEELISVLRDFNFEFKTEYIDRKSKSPRNPCVPYNIAAGMASGEYLNLTNPENAHMGPILKDAMGKLVKDDYLVYGCMNLRGAPEYYSDLVGNLGNYVEPEPMAAWYQHSKLNNRLLHFCSVINREKFLEIGGFDNSFSDGSGYDDNDLIQSIVSAGLRINPVDSPYCAHQPHARNWDQESTFVNLEVIKNKWGFFPIDKWEFGNELAQLRQREGARDNSFLFKV